MSKKMMVNATHPEENRVAIVEDGILTELDIEIAGREPTKGNIYKAVVVRVETGLQAAFVDYGAERLGFLQIDEINYATVKPDYNPAEEGRRPRISDLLTRGQELLVQITKEERGTKGAALTTYLSLAGRYMVLMPGSQTRGVSRKAESDSQRKELKKAMSSLDLAEGIGYIVRTAALDQTREELERDYRYLIRLYESIKELDQKAKAPALIYKESNLMIRSIRDYFTTEMDEVLIDDSQVFKEAKDFFQMVMPDHVNLVKLHQERRPIFSRYQIEDQIETLSRNKVALPSGGSIVIDPTEALVAIDVNSGKMASEQGVEATATKTNLEAAAEVGRQLRLRDLGGLIVIDFIDMRERKNMRLVENQVKKSLENDKARVSVGRISKFGLLELSRQRIKAALTQGSHLPCPHCNGTGHLKSPETQAVALLRRIHASAAKGQVSRVEAQLPIEVASYLLNHNREELVEMERRYQLQIHIHGNRDFLADQVEIEIQKREKEKATKQEFVAAGPLSSVLDEAVKKEEEPPIRDENAGSEPAPEAEPGKKRRRRRKRKTTATPDENRDKNAVGEQSSESSTEDKETIDALVEASVETQETESTKKPQRRRRSQSKAKATDKDTVASNDATEKPLIEVPVSTNEPEAQKVSENTVDEPQKTKPRRSRRKPATVNKESQAKATSAPEGQDATEPSEQVTHISPDKSGEEAAEKPATEEKQTAKKSPARGRKKSESTKKEEAKSADLEVKSVDPQSLQTGDEPTDKPKVRKPGRTKAKPKKDATETKEAASVEVQPTEEKPTKKAPVRRPRKKTPAPEMTTTSKEREVVAAQEKPTVAKTEEQAKPKRTRTIKKKQTETEPAP